VGGLQVLFVIAGVHFEVEVVVVEETAKGGLNLLLLEDWVVGVVGSIAVYVLLTGNTVQGKSAHVSEHVSTTHCGVDMCLLFVGEESAIGVLMAVLTDQRFIVFGFGARVAQTRGVVVLEIGFLCEGFLIM
jgi:hypothetical protein